MRDCGVDATRVWIIENGVGEGKMLVKPLENILAKYITNGVLITATEKDNAEYVRCCNQALHTTYAQTGCTTAQALLQRKVRMGVPDTRPRSRTLTDTHTQSCTLKQHARSRPCRPY